MAIPWYVYCHREPAESGRGDPAVWLRASPEIASSLTRAPYTGRSVEKKIKSSLNAPRNDSGGEVRLVSITIKANCGKLLRVGPDLNCFSFLKKKVLFFLKNQAVNNNGVKSCQNESLSLVFFSILFHKFPNADRWD